MPTEPITIHGLDPSGLNVVVGGAPDQPFTARAETLNFGDELVITPAIRELNTDRDGVCWLDWTPDEQGAHWRRIRFGRGPAPESVTAELAARDRAAAIAERDNLIRTNPRLAKATNAELRLAELNRRIGDL